MGSPVVLVPGLQSDGSSWRAVYDDLACRHPVTIPSGHHHAETIEKMGAITLAQLPARFHLVGWSMGGYIAFEILRRRPESLLSLVLISTTAAPEEKDSPPRRQAAVDLAAREGIRAYQERNLVDCLHQPEKVDPEIHEAMLSASEQLGLSAFQAQTRAIMNRPDSRADLTSCPCPVVIVAGRQDRVIPVRHAHEMHALTPGSRLYDIPNCGHCPPLEQPGKVVGIFLDHF